MVEPVEDRREPDILGIQRYYDSVPHIIGDVVCYNSD